MNINPFKKNVMYKIFAFFIRVYSNIIKYYYKITHKYPSSYPYISGDSFRSLCNKIWDAEESECPFKIQEIKKGDLIYIGGNHIRSFFSFFNSAISSEPFILISGNDDTNIDESFINILPSSLYHWFAQNCLVSHERITPIPIGLENRRLHWHGNIADFNRLRKKRIFQANPFIIYGFAVGNNKKERSNALRVLEQLDWAYKSGNLNSFYYRRFLRQFGLVASPPGNGEDCHRTWEALYLGVAPVVKRSYLTEYFFSLGLPLIIIDNWEELCLWDKLKRQELSQKARHNINHTAIFMPFWEKKINLRLNEIKHAYSL